VWIRLLVEEKEQNEDIHVLQYRRLCIHVHVCVSSDKEVNRMIR